MAVGLGYGLAIGFREPLPGTRMDQHFSPPLFLRGTRILVGDMPWIHDLSSSAVPTITLPVLSRGVQQNQQHRPLIPEDLDNLELPLRALEEGRMPLVVASRILREAAQPGVHAPCFRVRLSGLESLSYNAAAIEAWVRCLVREEHNSIYFIELLSEIRIYAKLATVCIKQKELIDVSIIVASVFHDHGEV